MDSCVYAIVNTITAQQYIGSTHDFKRRQRRHVWQLRNKRHHNIWLQRSYNKYGADSFTFVIIEKCDRCDLFDRETYHINAARLNSIDLFNLGSVGGGDNLSGHPNKNDIIKKMSESNKGRKCAPRYANENSNWRGGRPKCTNCGAMLQRENMTGYCNHCMDRNGENNQFYGKKHSDETKEKLRLHHLGKKPGNARRIRINGVEYLSMNDAASALNLVPATVSHRVRSKSFPDYEYV